MKRIEKSRGMSPNEVRWSLSMKVLNGSQHWSHVNTMNRLWAEKFANRTWAEFHKAFPEITAFSQGGFEATKAEMQGYPDSLSYETECRRRWENRTGAIYLSTNAVTTKHDKLEDIGNEIKNFINYCLANYQGDFAFCTLVIQDAGLQQRSLKWQLHVTAAEAAELVAEAVGAF